MQWRLQLRGSAIHESTAVSHGHPPYPVIWSTPSDSTRPGFSSQRPFRVPVFPELVNLSGGVPHSPAVEVLDGRAWLKLRLLQVLAQPSSKLWRWLEAGCKEPTTRPHPLYEAVRQLRCPGR